VDGLTDKAFGSPRQLGAVQSMKGAVHVDIEM
jgi:hypothetical protein